MKFFIILLSIILNYGCNVSGKYVKPQKAQAKQIYDLDLLPSFKHISSSTNLSTYKIYYHSTNFKKMDEVGLIYTLLRRRKVAVLSSFGENYVLQKHPKLSLNKILLNNNYYTPALEVSAKYIQYINDIGLLKYGLDYLWAPKGMKRDFTLLSGEGYPPFEEEYVVPKKYEQDYQFAPRMNSGFPAFTNAPNGDFYPKANRYILFTSPHKRISSMYGEVILEVQENVERGLSLPDYCVFKHGKECLTSPLVNISYWAKGDLDEYVIPSYIPAEDIKSGIIKYGFSKNNSLGREMRKYRLIQSHDSYNVQVFDCGDRLIGNVDFEQDSIIRIKFFPNPELKNNFDVGFLTDLLENPDAKEKIIYDEHPYLLKPQGKIHLMEYLKQTSGIEYDIDRNIFWIVLDKTADSKVKIVGVDPNYPNRIKFNLLIKGNSSDIKKKLANLFNENGNLDLEAIRMIPNNQSLLVAWEGKKNALLEIIPESGEVSEIIELNDLPKTPENEGVEGIVFNHTGNRIYISLEKPPRIFEYSWPSPIRLLREITLPANIKCISDIDYDNNGTKNYTQDDTLLLLDRDMNNLFEIDLNGRILNCFALLFTDPRGKSYTYASPEGLTIRKDRSIVLITDPWEGHYLPCFEDGDDIPDYYKNNNPMLYSFKRPRKF